MEIAFIVFGIWTYIEPPVLTIANPGLPYAGLPVTLFLWAIFGWWPMIPPGWRDPVWGRAQSCAVPPEGRTGPVTRLAVLDWTDLI